MLFVHVPQQADTAFLEFWTVYPLHKAKKDAEKAWRQVNGATHLQAILEAIQAQKRERLAPGWHPNWPYPASWLRAERWNDDVALSARLTLGDDSLWATLCDRLEAHGTVTRYHRLCFLQPCQVVEEGAQALIVDVMPDDALSWVQKHYQAGLEAVLAQERPGCVLTLRGGERRG